MRSVKKLSPPRDVAHRDRTSRTLRQARDELLAGLSAEQDPTTYARARFDALDKAKLRKELLREQRGICIFCEVSIQEGGYPELRIDHWVPISRDPTLALTWENLHLSCARKGTCDDHKSETPLVRDPRDPNEEDLPWPCDARTYQAWIGYSKGGEIYVRADAPPHIQAALEVALHGIEDDDGVARPTVLNLNIDTLVKARKAAYDAVRTVRLKAFPDRPVPDDVRESRAVALERADPFPKFVSVQIATWRGEIGKHR